jgi:hypothetical protein
VKFAIITGVYVEPVSKYKLLALNPFLLAPYILAAVDTSVY